MAYGKSVFINCPFDDEYRPICDALVFAVQDCGFAPRSAQEVIDAGEVRIDKILRLIRESRYGTHDISRTEVDRNTKLPRFNMPLELGLFMGAKAFGSRSQRQKILLVLENRRYLYQKYCSDIGGQDVVAHHRQPPRAVTLVRDWLSSHASRPMPGGRMMVARYHRFRRE